MEKILNVIKKSRKEFGYSYEVMADKLCISPAAYRKIEQNQTKLTVDRLLKIIEFLEIPIENLFDSQYYHNVNTKVISNQEIENVLKELIKSKDEQIATLKELLNKK